MKNWSDRIAVAVGTGLGSGYFPIFPGTVGSAAGIVIYVVLVWLGALGETWGPGWPVTIAVVFVLGVPSARRCESTFGPDDKRIVIDEVWGMLIACFMLPPRWPWIFAAFVLFRLFDVVKPFPARRVEHVGGGFGVMLDDGIAAVYANIVLHVALAVLP